MQVTPGLVASLAVSLTLSCTNGSPSAQVTDTRMHTTLTVWAPQETLNSLTVEHAHRTSVVEGGAIFESDPGADWAVSFTGRLAGTTAPIFSLTPFMCANSPGAVAATASGSTVTEHRAVEIIDGVAWATGTYGSVGGHSFFPRCDWLSADGIHGGEETTLDGPSRCDEPSRSKTSLELRDSNGTVLSRPEVCAAFQYDYRNGVISVSLSRAAEAPGARAFALNLSHCLRPGETLPLSLQATELAKRICVTDARLDEAANLGIGAHEGTATTAVAGTWRIEAADRARGSTHRSNIDVTFEDPAGQTYRVVGQVEVPQIEY